MKKPVLRGYFGSMFFEFILQDRLADAIIILPGFPSGNDFTDLIDFFYNKGYHVFVPRYRGMYQSTGVFLSKNPIDELVSFLDNLDSGFAKSLWDGKKQGFRINKKIIVGAGFGGALALGLAAKSGKISHLMLQAPIWDFNTHNVNGDEQDMEKMAGFVKSAYKNCYRFTFKNFKRKMKKFTELTPDFYMQKVKQMPVLVMHDPNDKIVSFKHSQEKMEWLQKKTYLEHYFGHKLTKDMLAAYWKEIDKFIKVNYVG